MEYRLDSGSINTVKYGDLKYFWGYQPPRKADFSRGDVPAFYLKRVLWNRADKIKIRYWMNDYDKVDYFYNTNALNKFYRETRKCFSRHDSKMLKVFDQLNNSGPGIEPRHIN